MSRFDLDAMNRGRAAIGMPALDESDLPEQPSNYSDEYCQSFRALGLELDTSLDSGWVARFAEVTKTAQADLASLSSFALWTSLAVPERLAGNIEQAYHLERLADAARLSLPEDLRW